MITNAQNSKKKPELNANVSTCVEIESIVKSIVACASSLENPANVTKILSYIDTSYREEKILMGIDEDAKILRENYETFKNQCERFVNNNGVEINYSLKKILKSDCGERLSYCIHETEFSIIKNGKIAYKGNQIRTFYFFKRQGVWKIFKAQTIETRTEIYNLECECTLEKIDENSYNSNIKVPKGQDYESIITSINFSKKENELYIVSVGDDRYEWEKGMLKLNNLNYSKDNPAPQPIKLTSKEKVIAEILRFRNKQNCTTVSIKNKK
jgi:hypothetical protein